MVCRHASVVEMVASHVLQLRRESARKGADVKQEA